MIKREFYLTKIRNLYSSELIKVIIGFKQCGKSVLLMQIMDELKENNIKSDHIIYLNFEDYNNIEFTNAKTFHEYIKKQIKDNKKYYLLFDEIQNVEDYERVINSFRATLNVSIFITGSNSSLLSGELATHLAGRYIQIDMLPFSFQEYLTLKQEKTSSINIDDEFYNYLIWGGMPLVNNLDLEEEKLMYLKDLFNTVVLKDIVERNKIKDVQ